jgi:hypothetical protein
MRGKRACVTWKGSTPAPQGFNYRLEAGAFAFESP